MARFIIQPHIRLQEWVAEEKGYFRSEGLGYEFDASFASTSSTTSSVKTVGETPAEARSGAFEDMQKGRTCDVSAACHWAVHAAASAHHGRMWGHAYSICPSGIFVPPESPIARPDDLADTNVGVGYHSGSHYSAIQRDIDREPERYKHYWLREMPEDLKEIADVRRFGPGERVVFEPYTREMFEKTHGWMQTWDLFSPELAAQAKYEAVLA